jgi:stage II sporulation protein D
MSFWRLFPSAGAVSLLIVLSAAAYGARSAPAPGGDYVRVLIQDDQFNRVPRDGEKLALLEKTDGMLLIRQRPYTGRVEVWRGKNGLYLVNEIALEDYVKSVVKSETGKDWDLEALKAQAVVARTYAVNRKLHANGSKYDLTSSVMDQLYYGDVQDEKVEEAVRETKGEILIYDGKPIEALYHSTCGGVTEDASEVFGHEVPYLKSAKHKCDLSPYAFWARKFPLSGIAEALGVKKVAGVKIKDYTVSGRVRNFEIVTDRGVLVVKGNDLRRLLGWKNLPSTLIKSLELDGDSLSVEGSGYGHGVGLCQWSALEMARDGKDYKEILSSFYQGTQLVSYENP